MFSVWWDISFWNKISEKKILDYVNVEPARYCASQIFEQLLRIQ